MSLSTLSSHPQHQPKHLLGQATAIGLKNRLSLPNTATSSQIIDGENSSQKKLMPFMMGICITLSSSFYPSHAQANVFDSLLRILLPSYSQGNQTDTDQPDTDSQQHTTQNDNTESGGIRSVANPTTDVMNDSSQQTTSQTSANIIPTRQPSLYALLQAEFDADRGDITKALQIYKQQAFNDNATAVFERALNLSLKNEPVQESLAFAQAWQQQNPDHIPAWFYVAHLALKAHDYNTASDALNQILTYDPQADLSEILIGIYPNNASDQQQLLSLLQQLPDHENPSLLVMQAGLQLQFGQPELALVNISKALKHQPDNEPFITLKADILQKILPATDVIDYISTERQRLPDSKGLYLYEIRYRLARKQSQQAWELLLQAHQRFKQDEEITLLAALVGIDIEAYSQADELLLDLATSPYYLDQAYYYLGISAERQHNYAMAERYLSKVMQEDLVLSARRKVVAIQLLNNDPDAALATLDKLSAQFDIYAPESAVLQAEILRHLDKTEQAQQVLQEASQRYPDDVDVLFAQAQLFDNKADYDAKQKVLSHLLALDPENTEYRLAYATLLFESGKDSAQGLRIARDIVAIPFGNPNYDSDSYLQALNLLASDALAQSKYQEVIDRLSIPYEVMPTLKTGVLLLRAYQGLGNDEQVSVLLQDLQNRFAFGQKNVADQIQSY
ncbi:tetratricopeptide repeat protein [Psychrobacter sp. I-STPA6b]|uniref:tetratricopeptide repeat protein n=1 Tax=Psychrobacter sp. I-STPA6b TaxID=2585718 RepID=UPI001D0C97F0|nr:hypothetical protein [Psychrobacter sp. I-STPA6b]